MSEQITEVVKTVLAWLDGKRTYGLCVLIAILYALKKHGVEIPDEVLGALVALTVMTLRSAVAKNGVIAQDIKDNAIQEQKPRWPSANLVLLLLIPAMMLGGCNRLVKWDAATDAHVRATQKDNVLHWEKCFLGDSDECTACLNITLAEMAYIADNNSVTMDKEFKSRFSLMQAKLQEHALRCSQGKPIMCYEGARTGINYMGVVLAAVDDVNVNPRKY